MLLTRLKLKYVNILGQSFIQTISDFTTCYKNHGEKCVRRKWVKKYEEFIRLEREALQKNLLDNP
jgi:hypothetical protein